MVNKAADKAKSHNIFYILSSAGIDRRLEKSKDHISNYSPNIPESTMLDSKNYQSQTHVAKDLFNSTMPKQFNRSPIRNKNFTSTPKSTKHGKSHAIKLGTKNSSRKRRTEKRKNDILKVIFNCIKRNEERMSLTQRSLFSNVINEQIMESSTGLSDKLTRAIQTYNEKLQRELINHINLKLKIA